MLDNESMKRWIILICLWCAPTLSFAFAQPAPLDQAFQLRVIAKDAHTIVGIWNIKPGYYLYRDRIHFSPLKPDQDRLGQPIFPPPDSMKAFPGVGNLAVYAKHLEIITPILKSTNKIIYIKVNFQGCSEAGFCYPPTSTTFAVNLAGNFGNASPTLAIDLAPELKMMQQQAVTPLQLLEQNKLFPILLGFFIFGLLLSLTPCVLPMIPIVSTLIVGQQREKKSRGFSLSVVYVLGMALTYAVAGIIFGFIGGTVQALLQKPLLIVIFSLVFIAMALSLFGLFTLQLPSRLQTRLQDMSNRQSGGGYWRALVTGAIATLVLSPCVTPPLVAVLSYIGQSGNAALGGSALFMMGIGMGVPLMLIGAFSRRLIPKAGPWMNWVKHLLGILMLAVAIQLLSRVLPPSITAWLWVALAIGVAVSLRAFHSVTTITQKLFKILGILIFIYSIILALGTLSGNPDPIRPLNFVTRAATTKYLKFIPVKSVMDVRQQLELAKAEHQPVMLDFYADWCISCKEMEKSLQEAKTQLSLQQFRRLRADVTKNDLTDRVLQQHYGVVAPPTILFFDPSGQEISGARIVGEVSARELNAHLKNISQSIAQPQN